MAHPRWLTDSEHGTVVRGVLGGHVFAAFNGE